MSNILIEIFPLEVIDIVFLFMPKNALKTLYDNFPVYSTLRLVARSRLFKQVSVRELGQLARLAKLDVHIEKLTLPGKTELLLFLKDNPSFVTGISYVDIKHEYEYGHNWDQAKYSILKEIQFLNYSLDAGFVSHFDPSQVPSTLTLLTLQFVYEPAPKRIRGWPTSLTSLTSLTIRNHHSAYLIELPLTLKRLSCHSLCGVWHKFPPKLEYLEFTYSFWIPSDHTDFPKSLATLLTTYCDIPDVQKILDKLPGSLKTLEFRGNVGSDFSSLKYPNSIEFLSLAESDVDSVEGSVFPKRLKELRLVDTGIPPDQYRYFPGVNVII
ncbi:CIC11C00000001291 [Sungouiella intermedia]|uniref:CIC11C00000001291 n=1 Tax=Sungouiella intermedia TaxID=45354 RepID=A0A1L0DLY7_9ASCO|nr:CIC11C00000001291 [[Candida] intermedia]